MRRPGRKQLKRDIGDEKRFALLHGPYRAPKVAAGEWLLHHLRGEVKVKGFTDARIPWPYGGCRGIKGRASLILCGDLIRAVQCESALAVCFWWGVGSTTVSRWRRALQTPVVNEGTSRLHGRWMSDLVTPEDRRRGIEILC